MRVRSLLLLPVLWACETQPRVGDDGSVCADARALLGGCGVTLTLVQVRDCSGPSEAVAQCIVDNADDCESLAEIRLDECLEDVLDPAVDDPPYTPVPVDPSGTVPEPPIDPDATEDDDALCADRVDNDGDGFVDCDDVDCSQSADVSVCAPRGVRP